MFKKVLVANRGEIACRVMRTLRRMGIKSIAVFSEADAQSLHVVHADEAICIGPPRARESYLDTGKLLQAVKSTGADGVHPGYGFLSENADFAEQLIAAGVAFIGPTPEQLRTFGLKHRARELAQSCDVPLVPGSGLLGDLSEAKREAERIGYPLMLKSTAGGGGIGLSRVNDETELASAFESVVALSQNNFGSGGVFIEKLIERARHIEMQVFGDGRGRVVHLGERDCSVQRRNQKVIEETPAPLLSEERRTQLAAAALRLMREVKYASAGTVEFIFDADTQDFYFLEVNTRLQVEHGVTEAVSGVDLVEWMVRQASGDEIGEFESYQHAPSGHSIQARVYAESPASNFLPSSGLMTLASFPEDVRVDTWLESGVEVPAFYDPLLAKIIVHGATRDQALERLLRALTATKLSGIQTNLAYLKQVVESEPFRSARTTTTFTRDLEPEPQGIDVLSQGTQSTLQDHPGRVGYWQIGVPPSGPMDALALRLGNRVVGNPEGTTALELTVKGPTLRFNQEVTLCLAGAEMYATLDGVEVPYYEPVRVSPGQVLEIAGLKGPGLRAYLCVRGGFEAPPYLGSSATFTLGGFGGHGGRALRVGDTLVLAGATDSVVDTQRVPERSRPVLRNSWELGVLYGPHGAPDFFTREDIETFFSTDYQIHYNSARTGVRLIGPKPTFARKDGGEAGLHPSNIHDCAYTVGAVDFTGDMPIILGPDGPSLGGFVCPATVIQSELWKLGQLAPGDKVRFVPVSREHAEKRCTQQNQFVRDLTSASEEPLHRSAVGSAIAAHDPDQDPQNEVVYRASGDRALLVEFGPPTLDLNLRFRAHALMESMLAAGLPGVTELTPGIRSVQVQFDPARLSFASLLKAVRRQVTQLPDVSQLEVPTRVVHLPLSWDDEATQLAIKKYTELVRRDAPWAPSNIEFIRRINGLDSVDEVKQIVFDASYLVLGLGDVYLGAPVATPVDPRHRLVTTKYNPARTWTPENAVGIGGAYLCIYGMEGPGGYQFVGRTLQVYNRFRRTKDFTQDKPWLLRFFDQLRFYPVSGEELLDMRRAFAAGRFELQTSETTFRLAEYNQFLRDHQDSIHAFKARQQAAFEAERGRWAEADSHGTDTESSREDTTRPEAPADGEPLVAPVPGSVWKIVKQPGESVAAGEALVVLESMKMEIAVESPVSGRLLELRCREGQTVAPGDKLGYVLDES